ncbi:MAG: tol-pal system YbgF family protein, partial [Desulfamplus sp.]
MFAFTCHAATPEEQYNSATNSYESLKKSPERQQYRHNWLNCIQKFSDVYSNNPNHSLASSGMYRSAELYLGLYKISGMEKDKIEAIDLLNRIIKRYPSSTDRDMAEKLLLSASSKQPSQSSQSNLSQSDSTSASKKSSDSDSDKGNSGSPKFSDISSSSNANGY